MVETPSLHKASPTREVCEGNDKLQLFSCDVWSICDEQNGIERASDRERERWRDMETWCFLGALNVLLQREEALR